MQIANNWRIRGEQCPDKPYSRSPFRHTIRADFNEESP